MTPSRFRLLLCVLLGLSFVLPLRVNSAPLMLGLFGVTIPLVGGTLGHGIRMAVLAGFTAGSSLLGLVGMPGFDEIGTGFSALYFAVAAAVVLRQVFQCRCSSFDVLAGALSCFLLVGIAWTSVFGLLEQLQPGSLTGQGELDASSLFYFCFVTLLTVGYGDIAPATPLARQLAVMTGLTGMLFTAVVLSSLVTLQLSRERT